MEMNEGDVDLPHHSPLEPLANRFYTLRGPDISVSAKLCQPAAQRFGPLCPS